MIFEMSDPKFKHLVHMQTTESYFCTSKTKINKLYKTQMFSNYFIFTKYFPQFERRIVQ